MRQPTPVVQPVDELGVEQSDPGQLSWQRVGALHIGLRLGVTTGQRQKRDAERAHKEPHPTGPQGDHRIDVRHDGADVARPDDHRHGRGRERLRSDGPRFTAVVE